ncbi:hypothetical protein BDV10DRAFT_183931 [Aspergillus recurvatus]
MVVYPSKKDVDSWEELGNPGWNWASLSEYLRKSETFTHPSAAVRDELSLEYINETLQGGDRPIQVSFGDGPYPAFSAAWSKVFENLNYQLTGDPISGVAKGAFCNPATINPKDKSRSHAGVAYYNDEIAKHPNLRVLTDATVERIVLKKNADGPAVATGVQFTPKDGVRRTVDAATEVVISAGAVKSPQLLELSGIGGAELLSKHGIEVLLDNPNVGENLQEHGFVPFSWEIADGQQSGEALRDSAVANMAMEAWQHSGAGPLGLCPLASAYMTLPIHARLTQWIETLASAEPMASLIKKDGRRLHSNKRVDDLETARELARDRIVAHCHVTGTTAMTPRESGGAVDERLRVYGTKNLRVVDAGIIPLIPQGNIQAIVFALAEKAADLIKDDRY